MRGLRPGCREPAHWRKLARYRKQARCRKLARCRKQESPISHERPAVSGHHSPKVDGRNIYSGPELRAMGFKYYGIRVK